MNGRRCGACKHATVSINREPCISCDNTEFSNWEAPGTITPNPDSEESRNLKIRRLIVGAEIELAGMVAENMTCNRFDQALTYDEAHFYAINDQLTEAIKEVTEC